MTERLDHIEKKVQQVVEKLNTCRRENAVLLEQNNSLKAGLDAKSELLGKVINSLADVQRTLAQQPGELQESSQESNSTVEQCIQKLSICIDWLKSA